MNFETDRLILRDFVHSDMEDYHKWISDSEVMHYLDWKTTSIEETKKNFFRTMEDAQNPDRKEYYFAIIAKETKQHVGSAGFTIKAKHADSGIAELGYFLLKDYWGKGIAVEAVLRIIEFGFNSLKLHKISASCDKENKPSERIMQKCGLSKEGELRRESFHLNQWRNKVLYSILKDEWENLKLN